jgi:hypothetical protein
MRNTKKPGSKGPGFFNCLRGVLSFLSPTNVTSSTLRTLFRWL